MKSILTNTIKITVAAVLAILCAQALKLDFAVSAGIVAILSVQPTKKETLRLPQNRIEFEDRANLFILMERLKEFLQIKRDFILSQDPKI